MKFIKFMMFIAVLTSCTLNTPYHHFESVPLSEPLHFYTGEDETTDPRQIGWDKEDTLTFATDTLTQSGKYTLSLEVRTSNLYPYRNLSLAVEETVFPSKVKRMFTVELEPRAEEGVFLGLGLGRHELSKVLACQYLNHGDSIYIKVYHKMRRLVLPGVTDIGIKLERLTVKG